jgi:ATP-binding cassette subfamily B protein
MQQTIDYIKSVKFALSYFFTYSLRETIISIIIEIFGGLLPYASAFMLGRLVDASISGLQSQMYTEIYMFLALYTFVSALPTILGNLQTYYTRQLKLRVFNEIELDILQKREQIDIAHYENPKIQDLMQRAFRNGVGVILQLSSGQYDTIRAITSFLVGTAISIHFNSIIYLIIMITAIPGFITDIKFAKVGWSIFAKDSPEQRKLVNLRLHIIGRNNLFETKLFQSAKKLLTDMRKILVNFMNQQMRLEKNKVLYTSLGDFIAYVGFAFGLFLIIQKIIHGEIAIGMLVYMMGTLSNVRASIANLLNSVSSQYENHLITKDIMTCMSLKPIIVENPYPIKLSLTVPPTIIFENVGFKYSGSNTWSLRHITLTFKAGDKIGLVGNNGAGKTTLVKLLCRIYDPTEGRILINNIDLKDIAIQEWWSYLSVMFQDYARYDFVVTDAIAISQPNNHINREGVQQAARNSQASHFIERWDKQYDEQLGVEFGGKELSKGQNQKMAIARALYRNAFLMILDEPTASIDAESEAEIFDALNNLSDAVTAVFISHDFSTILQCDYIFVLENGGLIEQGNHKELMKLKGTYAELYNLQAKRFKK